MQFADFDILGNPSKEAMDQFIDAISERLFRIINITMEEAREATISAISKTYLIIDKKGVYPDNMFNYILISARNEALNEQKALKKHTSYEQDNFFKDLTKGLTVDPVEPEPYYKEEDPYLKMFDKVKASLGKLSPVERELVEVVLKDPEATNSDLATLLGITKHAVRTRKSRAFNRLRKMHSGIKKEKRSLIRIPDKEEITTVEVEQKINDLVDKYAKGLITLKELDESFASIQQQYHNTRTK